MTGDGAAKEISMRGRGRMTPGLMTGRALLIVALVAILGSPARAAEQAPPLQLEAKIPLGKVSGRIDHLAVDIDRQRLFVAELGNNSVGVIDLRERKVI